MDSRLPYVFDAGQIVAAQKPFDATFIPSPYRSDLLQAKIVLDVVGDEAAEFDDLGFAWIKDVVLRLPQIVEIGRSEVTQSNLELYNDGWCQEGDPVMSADTFAAALGTPTANLMWTPSENTKSIEVWFSNVPMFLGHSLFCIYRDDEALTVIDCGMFG